MLEMTSDKIFNKHHQSMAVAQGVYHELAFKTGQGSYLYDYEGRKYIDLAVGICTGPLGHCHPEVVKEIKDQAGILIHTSMVGYYKENIEHAELLKSTGPDSLRDGKVLFMNSGSEAIEAALKMTRMVSRRPIIIAFMGGFHGRPMGALAATASKSSYKKGITGLMVGVQHAVYPYCYRCPMGHKSVETCGLACINIIKKLIKHTVPPEDLAGILFEPMAGENGYIVPPSEFVQELRKICDETGALLIADEIQTGLGRSGKMWACEHHEVEPDVLVFGKAAGGQMPLGGFIAKKDIVDKWEKGSHGSTYGGHPISCRAGKKTVEIILQEKLADRASILGQHIVDRFNEAKKEIPAIGDVRGMGLMVGVELIKKDGNPNKELVMQVLKESGKRGAVITNVADSTLRISPPLNISKKDIDQGVDILLQTIIDLG